jgi:Flp pilus assembly protein TadC
MALTSGAAMSDFLMLSGAGAATGYMLPFITVLRKSRARVREMRETLPDTLDLIVVCVEAGMGVDAALNRVGKEQNSQQLALGEELMLTTQEMQAGSVRKDALIRLAERVGIEEFRALVTFLTQTEEMGGSIARSLRVYAETMRDKRSQAAEEAARKTVIKLIFPLVFFYSPGDFYYSARTSGAGDRGNACEPIELSTWIGRAGHQFNQRDLACHQGTEGGQLSHAAGGLIETDESRTRRGFVVDA